MSLVSANILLDPELKNQAQELFRELGMDLQTAVTLFLRQAVYEEALPFQPRRGPEKAWLTAAAEPAEAPAAEEETPKKAMSVRAAVEQMMAGNAVLPEGMPEMDSLFPNSDSDAEDDFWNMDISGGLGI